MSGKRPAGTDSEAPTARTAGASGYSGGGIERLRGEGGTRRSSRRRGQPRSTRVPPRNAARRRGHELGGPGRTARTKAPSRPAQDPARPPRCPTEPLGKARSHRHGPVPPTSYPATPEPRSSGAGARPSGSVPDPGRGSSGELPDRRGPFPTGRPGRACGAVSRATARARTAGPGPGHGGSRPRGRARRNRRRARRGRARVSPVRQGHEPAGRPRPSVHVVPAPGAVPVRLHAGEPRAARGRCSRSGGR